MEKDKVAIPGNCHKGYSRHYYLGGHQCLRCFKSKPEEGQLYCHKCGNKNIVFESLAEGYYCPNCGSSDQDE